MGSVMRLVCPNCDAQYEVDEKVIPENGRDVQCSNCGHTWFQSPEHMDADLAAEMGYDLAQESEADHTHAPLAEHSPKPDFDTDEDAFHEVEPNELSSQDDQDQEEWSSTADHAPAYTYDEDEDDDDVGPVQGVVARPRPSIDESIKDMLREEQEFSAPHGASEPLEIQTDLGLEEAEIATDQAMREKMARLRGLDPADPALTAGTLGSHSKRRDLLPDIEEINSTLSASSERDADGTVPDEQTRRTRAQRGVSRSIFAVFIIVASLLVALYVFAPTIANAVPSLAPLMDSYISSANVFRVWLDGGMSALSDRLNILLSQLNG